MLKHLRNIGLIFLLLATNWLAAQEIPVLDTVCQGAVRYYRVDGEPGSTYTWKLTHPSSQIDTLLSDADTVAMTWNYPTGTYLMESIQHSVENCDALAVFGHVIIVESPIVFAGPDSSICYYNNYYIADATAEFTGSLFWTTSGDGNFDDPTLLNPTYTPGPDDITTESVVLTLTGEGIASEDGCEASVSSFTLTLIEVETETVNIIPVSCFGSGDGSVQLSAWGGIEPYTFTLGSESNQTGLFTDLFAGDYTYTVVGYYGCEVTGTFTITEPEEMQASFDFTPPTCNGANNGTITIYDASGGSGSYQYSIDGINWYDSGLFADLAPGSYIPQTRDLNAPDCIIILGTIDLTEPGELTAEVSFTNITCFNANDGTISISNPTGGSGSYEYSITGYPWQSIGLFIDLVPGLYDVMIRDQNDPTCEIVLTTVEISEPEEPLSNAGNDAEICSNETYTLSGVTNMPAIEWTTSGTGTFNDPTQLAAIYTPGSEDIDAGQVTLTLTAFAGGNCEDVFDDMILTIWKEATAYAGENAEICEGDLFISTQDTATNYAALLWITSGTGTFDDNTILNPTSTPGPDDITAGSVDLTLTATGEGTCPDAVSTMTLTITGVPVADAGVDSTLCTSEISYTLHGSATNYASILCKNKVITFTNLSIFSGVCRSRSDKR